MAAVDEKEHDTSLLAWHGAESALNSSMAVRCKLEFCKEGRAVGRWGSLRNSSGYLKQIEYFNVGSSIKRQAQP
jgi:hypothetical protein